MLAMRCEYWTLTTVTGQSDTNFRLSLAVAVPFTQRINLENRMPHFFQKVEDSIKGRLLIHCRDRWESFGGKLYVSAPRVLFFSRLAVEDVWRKPKVAMRIPLLVTTLPCCTIYTRTAIA